MESGDIQVKPEVAPGVTPGAETTEYKQVGRADIIAGICSALGTLAMVLPSAIGALPEESPVGVILGIVLIVVGATQSVMVRLGYMKSRTVLKAESIKSLGSIADGAKGQAAETEEKGARAKAAVPKRSKRP